MDDPNDLCMGCLLGNHDFHLETYSDGFCYCKGECANYFKPPKVGRLAKVANYLNEPVIMPVWMYFAFCVLNAFVVSLIVLV